MASAEERRAAAEGRAKDAVRRAKIADSAYDKPGKAREMRAARVANDEALSANEEIKRELGPTLASARNNLRSNRARSQRAADEAQAILAGGGQRSDQWQ